MRDLTLLCSQSGEIGEDLRAVVTARDRDLQTLSVERPEDGQYYLSAATRQSVADSVEGSDDYRLVIDGTLHPGQMADLRGRLPSVEIRDRREAVWEWLGEANPVAETRFDLRQAEIERRMAAAAQREAQTDGPTGTSGELRAAEERVQQLRTDLEERRETAIERVTAGYADVDSRVVVVGRVVAPTAAVWTELTDREADATAGRPARPRTEGVNLGPHSLAVTLVPGVPGTDGLPEWFTEAVPGAVGALEAASAVFCVGTDCDGFSKAIEDRFDVACERRTTADGARETLRALLGTSEYAIRLPYADESNAFVSELHDRNAVRATEYDDAIYLRVELPETAVATLRQRVAALEGEIQSLPTDE